MCLFAQKKKKKIKVILCLSVCGREGVWGTGRGVESGRGEGGRDGGRQTGGQKDRQTEISKSYKANKERHSTTGPIGCPSRRRTRRFTTG